MRPIYFALADVSPRVFPQCGLPTCMEGYRCGSAGVWIEIVIADKRADPSPLARSTAQEKGAAFPSAVAMAPQFSQQAYPKKSRHFDWLDWHGSAIGSGAAL